MVGLGIGAIRKAGTISTEMKAARKFPLESPGPLHGSLAGRRPARAGSGLRDFIGCGRAGRLPEFRKCGLP
jgi:hypothetical protein